MLASSAEEARAGSLLLTLALLSPAHPTAFNAQGLLTRNDWTSLLLPENVNAKLLSSLAVQELEHNLLLLRRISVANQLIHLRGRKGIVASFGFLVELLEALTNKGVIGNKVGFDMRPVVRPRVIVAILLAVVLLSHFALALWVVGIEAVMADVTLIGIVVCVAGFVPLAVLRAGKALLAVGNLAGIHFTPCTESLLFLVLEDAEHV